MRGLESAGVSDYAVSYSYSYDLHNNPIKIEDKVSGLTTTRTYDLWGRLTSDGIEDQFSLNYQYDALGRLTSLLAPDTSSVRYSYTARLDAIARYSPSARLEYEHRYTGFDRAGRVIESELIHNLGSCNLAWDKKGRNSSIQTKYFSQSIPTDGFDAVGNLKTYSFSDAKGHETVACNYDDLYQLTEGKGIQNHIYAHDSLNNRLSKNSSEYTIDAHNKITSDGLSAYVYDKNGNLIQDAANSYAYDALGRLTAVKNTHGTTRYIYDSFNRRIKKNDAFFLYQGMREIGTFKAGKLTEFKVLGIGKGAELGASVAIELNGNLYCPIHDFRGNIVCLVDASQQVTESYRYTAFGECQVQSHHPMPANPWRFASKRYDPETGFSYFLNRYYSPSLGRWITPDPLGFADGPNIYAYVHNNPMTGFDLYGLLEHNDRELCDRVHTKNGGHVLRKEYKEYRWEGKVVSDEELNKEFSKFVKSKFLEHGENLIIGCNIKFTNGILNGEIEALDHLKYLSDLAGGVNVEGLHNASHGAAFDLFEAAAQTKIGMYSVTSRMLRNDLIKFHSKNPDVVRLLLSFSQGAAVVKGALELCQPKVQQQIISVAFGPAAIIPSALCKKSYNYVSWRDPVPFVSDPTGIILNRDCVYFLKPHPDANFFDHYFQSPTYREPLSFQLRNYIKTYGNKGDL